MDDNTQPIANRVTLRPVVAPDDEQFLQELYTNVRDDLVGIFDNEHLERQMLQTQYLGQKMTYESEFPNADHDIVLLDGRPVGRLLVERRHDSVFGVDLAVLSEFRNLGIGTVIVDRLIEEGSQRGVPFIISVVKSNPAFRLYRRLGCNVDGESATHFFLSWGREESVSG